ncbi:hypothetical protein [Corallococcus sp. AB030]|uniref:hypothetical protein n=1 Tax=Corallococcus sp. AB030 TaxID=2316716 RepID=UPI0011E5E30B|nr:hypothetical protein [Corallococcus sp. AB030]
MSTAKQQAKVSAAEEEITLNEAKRRFREFIESYSLLRPLRISLDRESTSADFTSSLLWPDAIHLQCKSEECKHLESTTWRPEHSRIERLQFKCSNCDTAKVEHWYKPITTKTTESQTAKGSVTLVKDFECIKVGQWPVWAPKIPNRLLKNLGPSAPLFRRGLACLQEGLGIGASAYFRRVIEEEVKTLLDLVERAARLDDDKGALENINLARQSQVASERLKIAIEKVPPSLRPGNANPLAILYGALSGAVHQEPEDVALATATRLLKTFIFLFEELKERMDAAEAYSSELNQLKNGSLTTKQ